MFSNKREYEPKFVFNKDRPEHNQFKTSTLRVASTFLEVSKELNLNESILTTPNFKGMSLITFMEHTFLNKNKKFNYVLYKDEDGLELHSGNFLQFSSSYGRFRNNKNRKHDINLSIIDLLLDEVMVKTIDINCSSEMFTVGDYIRLSIEVTISEDMEFVFSINEMELITNSLSILENYNEVVSKDSTEVVCKTVGEVRMIFQFNVGIVSYWLGKSQVVKDMTVSPLVALDLLITKHSL